MRKGQLTGFIILGVLVIILASFLLYGQGVFSKRSPATMPREAALANEYLTRCFQIASEAVLLRMGVQGGLYAQGIMLDTVEFPMWDYYQEGRNTMPPLEHWANMLAYNSEATVPYCLIQNETLPTLRQAAEPDVKAIIRDSDIVMTVNYPIDVEVQGTTTRLDTFTFIIPVRLKHIYEIAQDIVATEIANPSKLDQYQFTRYDVNTDIYPVGNNWIVILTDPASSALGLPFSLMFNNRFGAEISG